MRFTCLLILLLPFNVWAQEDFIVEKLPDFINSSFDEITPVPSRDGRTLYFTRVGYPDFDRTLWLDSVDYAQKLGAEEYRKMLAKIYSEIGKARITNPERAAFNQDVWIARGDTAGFQTLEHPGPPLNNALPNSVVTITPDPNALYVINQFKPTGDMKKGFSVIRRQTDSTWTFPEPVEIKDFYTIKSDVSLTMSFDGEVLILAAARFDSRDLDLYVCFREGENKWTAPRHMGNVLNSEKRELTPFLSEDHRTLFFASDRWNSSGGLDLFLSKREDDTWMNWTPPLRFTYPINSPNNESQPYFNMTSGYLYFTSQRDGSSDIFRVRIAPPQPTELVITGRILNKATNTLVPGGKLRYGSNNITDNIITTEDGYYTLRIPKGIEFQLIPEKGGFSGKMEKVLFRRDYYYFQEFHNIDLYLEPLQEGSKIELRPIFFQQSKAIILEPSYPELQRLADILIENPNMAIRVEGHTDNMGKAEDLLQLSRDRAQAVKDFLVERGIHADRIETVGHGAQFPLTENDSDEERSQNRRVEVRITKI